MKKALLLVSAFLFAFSLMSVGNVAVAKEMKGSGKVISVDKDAATLVFCPEGTKDEVTLKADDPKQLAGLKEGDGVKVQYDADSGVASKIKRERNITVPVGC